MDSKNILETIKEKNISPKPRWEFLLKDYIIWGLFGGAIVIGSLSVAVSIFMAKNTNWRYYADDIGPLKSLLINIPYFWLALIVIFTVIALYNLKHTKKGYRYSTLILVSGSVFCSMMLGGILYATGLGDELEEIFYRRVPFYQKVIHEHGKLLLAPERGRIVGVIINVQPTHITIKDFKGHVWTITTTTPNVTLGQRVLLLGEKVSEQEFNSRNIKPWIKRPSPTKPVLLKETIR